MPAHHNLEAYLDAYIAGGRTSATAARLPCSAPPIGRTGALTETPMHRIDAWRMIQRRAADAGIDVRHGCHTFRATGHHDLSRQRRHARKRAGDGRRTKARARRSSMIAPATRSRSMRSSGSRFEREAERYVLNLN